MANNQEQVPSRRRYDATRRQAAAAQTRQAIAAAAREVFQARGYSAATVAAIAAAAGVSHETVYATFGPKSALLRHLIETALSGADEPIPAMQRDIVRQVRDEPDPARILELFAHTVRTLQERLAPLFEVLSDGARTEPHLRAFAAELSARRVGHMREFVGDLALKGGLRDGLTIETAADVVWVMNSPEFYLLCVRERSWSPASFEQWLAESWKALFLPRAS